MWIAQNMRENQTRDTWNGRYFNHCSHLGRLFSALYLLWNNNVILIYVVTEKEYSNYPYPSHEWSYKTTKGRNQITLPEENGMDQGGIVSPYHFGGGSSLVPERIWTMMI